MAGDDHDHSSLEKIDEGTTCSVQMTRSKRGHRASRKKMMILIGVVLLMAGVFVAGITLGLKNEELQEESSKSISELSSLMAIHLRRQVEMTKVMSEIHYTVDENTTTTQLDEYEAYIRSEYEGMYDDIEDFDFHRTKSEGLKPVNKKFKRYEWALYNIWNRAFIDRMDSYGEETPPYDFWLSSAFFFLYSPQGEEKKTLVQETYDDAVEKVRDVQSSANNSTCYISTIFYLALLIVVIILCIIVLQNTYEDHDLPPPSSSPASTVELSDAAAQHDDPV